MYKFSRFRFTITALIVAIALGVILAGQNAILPRASAQSPVTSVIVELRGDPVVVAKAKAKAAGQSFNEEIYRRQVIAQQDQFLAKLRALGVNHKIGSVTAPNGLMTATIQYRFNYVYNGIALEIPDGVIPIIAVLDEVLKVHPNEPVYVNLNRAVDYTRATNLYGTPPRLTQFDALNTGGLEGNGVNIAVIDTGVDWTHEMFGGDPTPPQFGVAPPIAALNTNKKVIYYMNFTPAAEPDDFGHGTHVAAIAAGYKGFAPGADGLPLTADDVAVHGAAPQAKIMAYKVLTAVGSGVAASIIAAIEDAVQPRTITGQPKPVAHVINLSLGGAGNPDSPNSVACDNAALAGAVVVASAGNSGPGEATVGQPASSRRAITVGANVDPGSGPNGVDVVGGGRTDMRAYLLAGSADILSDITNNYVFCGLAETPDQVPDSVNGKIALIERGSTVTVGDPVNAGTGLASNKVAFAAAKGAIAAIMFNNVDGEITNLTVRKSTIPAFGMNRDNGLYLKSLIGSEEFGAISSQQIKIKKAQLFDPAMAEFSSRGPVAGFGQVKPDVTAPGVNVLSATVAIGGIATNTGFMFDPSRYISASGTSMSSPMTAGIAALIKQKHPDWTPSMVRAALVNTATNLRQINGSPVADGANTINEQGGGLVDALAAANARALMGVGQLGPNGTAAGRSYGICSVVTGGAVNQFCSGASNPDFTPSYSFGEVPIANVIGAATISQTVTINDITNGGGAGIYQLAVSNVRGVDQDGFRVRITDTNGNPISAVTVPVGGSASFNVKTEVRGEKVADPTQAQWYVTATRDFTRTPLPGVNLRMPFYYRAVRPAVAHAAPSLAPANNAEVSGSPVIDINGNYSLSYSFAGSPAPAKFRIEEQKDNGAWSVLADVDAGQTSHDISGRGNGAYNYRVAGLFPVEHGLLQGPYSATQTVEVNRRLESDVTALIQTAISNVSLANGSFEFDQTLKNTSTDRTILPPLKLTITAIQSASGTVRVTNADNGGNGMGTPATFDYSSTVGADRALTPGETSGARHFSFSNQSGELFQFTATVKGHFPDPAFSASSVAKSGKGKQFKTRIVFIADPQTGTVSVARTE